MKYALFSGCTIPLRVPNYELATRKVMDKLGIELVDIEDAGCCGIYHELINELTHLTMAGRILAKAEDMGLDIMVMCNGCNESLIKANKKLKEDSELRDKVNEILSDFDLQFKGKVDVKHYVRLLYEDYGVDKVKKKVKIPLNTLKVAAFYGCHILKPTKIIEFEDFEDPESLDKLIEATGAKSIDYYDKKMCCGGYVLAYDKDAAYDISGQKLQNIKDAGADVIVTICPFCNIMLESNQRAIGSHLEREFKLPVMHYPQLLGIAMGFSYRDMVMEQNRVRIDPKLFEE
ncbi:MAG TPA: CoB--CoM heterodisulfide reductase subunit B [Candidatus Altiarchaeales archaeon]|nr:CoB--CoM heterodisulfide reductase subunit B [Candidatus Altiarchaeales archaeon]